MNNAEDLLFAGSYYQDPVQSSVRCMILLSSPAAPISDVVCVFVYLSLAVNDMREQPVYLRQQIPIVAISDFPHSEQAIHIPMQQR